MNFAKLYEIQRILDDRIKLEHHLEDRDLVPSKILALLVELGELANETKTFKYWSNKPAAASSVILEEYVDCLHFILSLGLEYGYRIETIFSGEKKVDLVDQFNRLFVAVIHFKNEASQVFYEDLFREFTLLGNLLGFTMEEIVEAYLEKNKMNHQRQSDGY